MDELSIQTRNVDGLNDNSKRRKLFQLLIHAKQSIFLLQETHSSAEIESAWRIDWPGEILFCHGSRRSRGTAILFKKNIFVTIKKHFADDSGRFQIVDMEYMGKFISLVNIYGPNCDDPTF